MYVYDHAKGRVICIGTRVGGGGKGSRDAACDRRTR